MSNIKKIHCLDFKALMQHEAELIMWLVKNKDAFVGQELFGLRERVSEAMPFVTNPTVKDLDLVVWIPVWDPRDDGDIHYIHVGANLVHKSCQATYSVAFGTMTSGGGGFVSQTIRKIHWDFDFAGVGTSAREYKPPTHVQIGGRLGPKFETFGYTPEEHKGIDKPRVPTMPTCFVLMLHWIFLEYAHCDHISKVLEMKTWSTVVKRADKLILKDYFKSAHLFLQGGSTDSFLDFCYV